MININEIRAANPLPDVASAYVELKRDGREFKCLCPFHGDRNPSLTIYQARGDGAWRFQCFACGAHGDVIDWIREIENVDFNEAARRLGARELPAARPAQRALPPDTSEDWIPVLPVPTSAGAPFALGDDRWRVWNPKRERESTLRPSASWAYRDAAGELLGWVIRCDFDDGGKLTPTITWCKHRESGEHRWCMRPFPTPRPLLGLDDLAKRPDVPVLVVEGEKCRTVAARMLPGFVAVTWPGGTNGIDRVDWSPLLGRAVTLWPDADAPGVAAVGTIAGILAPHGGALRIIDTDGQNKGWDIADGAAEGMGTADLVTFCKPRVRAWVPVSVEPAPAIVKLEPEPPKQPEPDPVETRAAIIIEAEPVSEPRPTPPRRLQADLDATTAEDDAIPAKYSELNASLAFARDYEANLRFVDEWGRWVVWTGQRWEQDRLRHAAEFSKKLCAAISEHARTDYPSFTTERQRETVIARYGEKRTIMNVAELAKSDPRIAASSSQWDADKWAINTPKGVVDLRTGALRAPDRADYMTKITRVAPGGDCPTWRQFLDTVTAGDVELQGFLQRLIGYTLTGEVREQILVFVYGPGGNGKGTFLNTIHWLLGDYSTPASMDVFTERKHEAHPTELAGLMGARLVTAQETEEGKRWNESRIKALTGGDPIKARFMRQDEFEFMPQFQLIIAGNHKPGLRNVDEAIKRRMRMVPFDVDIPPEKRDPTLSEKLRTEASGILQWAVDGCLMWQQDGLKAPPRVMAATEEYLEQQDSIGAWIDECCDQGVNLTCRRGDLYRSFKAWAERTGEFALPQKRWVAAIETRGIKSKVKDGITFCNGLQVKAQADDRGDRWWGE